MAIRSIICRTVPDGSGRLPDGPSLAKTFTFQRVGRLGRLGRFFLLRQIKYGGYMGIGRRNQRGKHRRGTVRTVRVVRAQLNQYLSGTPSCPELSGEPSRGRKSYVNQCFSDRTTVDPTCVVSEKILPDQQLMRSSRTCLTSGALDDCSRLRQIDC